MKVSVIIPTYNGAHKIKGLLRSIEEQSRKPDEVIVVIDGSTDGTAEMLKREFFSFAEFRIIEQENGGRSKVRNRGAKEANGDLLIFFDDDIRLLPESIEKHYSFLTNNSGVMLVGLAKIDPAKIKNEDFSLFRLNAELKWIKNNSGDISTVTLNNYAFTSANLSMSKEIFFKTGGFDERLRDSEDFDLSMQAIIKGIPIYFDPSIAVWHDDFIKLQSYIKRQVEYIKSKQLLVRLKPEYRNMHIESFTYGVKKVGFIKRKLMSLLVFNRIWKFIFSSRLFLYFPKFLRYRLYDWVIFSSIYFEVKLIENDK